VRPILSSSTGRWVPLFAGLLGFGVVGCVHSPIDLSRGPAPLRQPRPDGDKETFEDSLTGGEVFSMYCNQCHNARSLAERPFANYQNVAAHMRVRAEFTGEEYEKLLEFLRRFHDVTPPTPPVEPGPKRQTFPQPISELREEIAPQSQPAAGAQPQPAAAPELPPAVQAEPLPLLVQPPAGP
jgi:hypothetical protein